MDRQPQITQILKRIAKKDQTPAPDQDLFETGFLDSFDLPDLVSELERTLSVQVPDSDLRPRNFCTIEKINSYLQTKGA